MAKKNNTHTCRKVILPNALDAAIQRWSKDCKLSANDFMVRLLEREVQEMDDELDEIWAKRALKAEAELLTSRNFDQYETAPDVSDVWDPYEGMYSEDDRDPFEGMYESDDRDKDTTYE